MDTCSWISDSSRRARSAVETFRELAPHVLLYLSPTTGDDLAIAPSCYLRSVISMLEPLNSASVLVRTNPNSSYHLGYSDFVIGDSMGGPLWIDSIHPNIQGARKITRFLVDTLERAGNGGSH